ncbi:MAG: hypothetical protein QOD74_941 [Variibacter sp.]|jgi:glycosyl transferase family 25|nr:hypothetical protein [Variibacter sp.]
MHVSIISLRNASARRSRMAAHLDGASLDWTFVDAAEGEPIASLPYDEASAVALRGRGLSRGEIGNFQSHWKIWHAMVEGDGPETQIVVEDDLLLDLHFDYDALADAAKQSGIEYLRLYFTWLHPFRVVAPFGRRQIVRFKSGPYGTQAYMITRSGAACLLDHITRIERPIDDELDRFWIHGLPPYAIYPCPGLDVGMESPMAGRSFNVRPEHALQKAQRFAKRVRVKLQKEVANMQLGAKDRLVKRSLCSWGGSRELDCDAPTGR